MFPITLETERLILKELTLDDLPSIQLYAADPEVVKYLIWGPNTEEDTRSFLSDAVSAQTITPRQAYQWAIMDKNSHDLIGGCGLRIKSMQNRIADIGYTFRRDVWGRGLATEAVHSMISFGLSTLKLHRIWATCDAENLSSARVLTKAGLRKEGCMREDVYSRDKWRDSLLYAVLETDDL